LNKCWLLRELQLRSIDTLASPFFCINGFTITTSYHMLHTAVAKQPSAQSECKCWHMKLAAREECADLNPHHIEICNERATLICQLLVVYRHAMGDFYFWLHFSPFIPHHYPGKNNSRDCPHWLTKASITALITLIYTRRKFHTKLFLDRKKSSPQPTPPPSS